MLEKDALARRIQTAINEAGLSQEGVARAFGVTEQAVSGWVRTGKIHKNKLAQLAQLTGRPVEYFLTDSGSAPPPSQVLGLDLAKLATAQKFLEDLFEAEGVVFIPSKHTPLLAAVYDELMTASTPNLVDMTTRFGRTIRGSDERQRTAGGAVQDDRGGAGEGSEAARVPVRKAS